ncbi:hypothetical protein AAFF_G00185110 [Aldrovandia affinis]|uniref:Uncharacterized protein n=1 Tax=Aldrovandia affinis TaxID=143900 RepID=A0AAD7W6F7_9TELE|nr:hypothetical protein AAFF_G00185110 [Aldrovandia affinis]
MLSAIRLSHSSGEGQTGRHHHSLNQAESLGPSQTSICISSPGAQPECIAVAMRSRDLPSTVSERTNGIVHRPPPKSLPSGPSYKFDWKTHSPSRNQSPFSNGQLLPQSAVTQSTRTAQNHGR